MRTKFRLLMVLAVALALGIVSIASAGGGAGDRHKKVRIIELTSTAFQNANLDLGAEGFGVGDRFSFSDTVFQRNRQVGMLGGECIAVRMLPEPLPAGQAPTSVTFNCVISIRLPRGQLTVQGLVSVGGGTFTLAITGGTGAYQTARGEADVTEPNATDAIIRVKLIL
jgi:hypothetical protein